MGGLLEARREDSRERLDELIAETAALQTICDPEPLCIYVTGSYGRLEAARTSDLDLFFLYGVKDPNKRFPRSRWLRIAGRLIEIADDLEFPEFSGDAEYLEVHNVAQIGRDLGSRVDDSENRFTARMLLLLESRSILNHELYDALIAEMLGFYYEDFEHHEDDFRPTFLINDILRFWRTLCLNYENKRSRRRQRVEEGKLDEERFRAESALANIKLRFSRLTTCHSMVAALAASQVPVRAEHVIQLVARTPLDRWAEIEPGNEDLVAELRGLYEGFLELTAEPDVLNTHLGSHESRAEARERADRYGELVAQLLQRSAVAGQLRYLLI